MSLLKKIAWEKSKKSVLSNIVLFDMDGTLTPPREKFDLDLLEDLRELSTLTEIGVVSGSNIGYIREQMEYILTKSELKYKIHLLPCNGTQYYPPITTSDGTLERQFSVSMKQELGYKKFQELIKILLELQEHISKKYIPLSGHFIDYRDSMVNWCPIGRSAEWDERESFVKIDNEHGKHSLRKEYLTRLRVKLDRTGWGNRVVCALGGDTSFDIYPVGWDKTFALRHFKNKEVWFVGDRCDEGGNDKSLYDLLKTKNRSFKTTGPSDTRAIIKTILGELK